MKKKMIPAFRNAEGGLFSQVEKADVGSSYQDMEKQGIALMGWADPFMPDRSMPEFIENAWIEAVKEELAPHYTAPIGSAQLKTAIAEKLRHPHGRHGPSGTGASENLTKRARCILQRALKIMQETISPPA